MPERCAECRRCGPVCPHAIARPAAEPQDVARCRACGACVDACATGARRVAGEVWALDELTALLLRDEPFYRLSGGGVTLSGGEPTVYPQYAGELAARLGEADVHVLLETCGHFAWEDFERRLLPHLSAVYFDLKLADEEEHRRHTGRGNARIRANLERLVRAGTVEVLPRIPLVPGITDGEANLTALADLLRDLGLPRVALLPYNPLWVSKREALGLDLPYARREWMEPDREARCSDMVRTSGLEVAG